MNEETIVNGDRVGDQTINETPVEDPENITSFDEVGEFDIDPDSLPILSPMIVQRIVDNLPVYLKFQQAMVKLTHTGDWILFGDQYLLESSGAERVAAPLGLYWEGERPGSPPDRTTVNRATGAIITGIKADEAYTIVYISYFTLPGLGRRVFIQGRCHSDDKFLKKYEYRWDETLKKKVRTGNIIPPAFVEVCDKALANLIRRGVTRFCGLRNPSKELLEMCGIEVDKIRKVSFGDDDESATGRAGQAAGSGAAGASGTGIDVMKAVQKAVKEAASYSGETESECLRRLSGFMTTDTPPKEKFAQSYSNLTPAWAGKTLAKANEEVKKAVSEIDKSADKETGEIPLPEENQ